MRFIIEFFAFDVIFLLSVIGISFVVYIVWSTLVGVSFAIGGVSLVILKFVGLINCLGW